MVDGGAVVVGVTVISEMMVTGGDVVVIEPTFGTLVVTAM